MINKILIVFLIGKMQSVRAIEGRPRLACTVIREESVLDAMKSNTRNRICAIASQLRMSRNSVQHVLNAKPFHTFCLQRVQLLFPDDYSEHLHFTQWFLQESACDVNFLAYVSFTDDANIQSPQSAFIGLRKPSWCTGNNKSSKLMYGHV